MAPLVVFDFDGTLADTLTDIAAALNRARGELGLPVAPQELIGTWVGEGIDVLIERALPLERRSAEERADLLRRYRAHYGVMMLEHSKPYAGVEACLAALSPRTLAVCSNKPCGVLERMLDAFALRSHFALVVGGDSLPFKKPDPRALIHICERLGATPAQTWMVGDSAVDVETGRRSGARTIGCAYGLRGREELVRAGAHFVVDSTSEIAEIIIRGG